MLQKPSNVWKFLFIITVIKLIYIYFIPITPQEAYYWYYSKHPALSYFDHPPMAAYSIWLGTHIFGDTVFGVKWMGVLWGFLTSIAIYFTVKEGVTIFELDNPSLRQQLPFVAVILYNLTIFSHLYSVTIMPDTPLIFFWALTIYFVLKVKTTDRGIYWLLAGISVGFGLLSKYTMIAIVPGIFLAMLFDKDLRKWFLSPMPYLGLILAAIIFLPVIMWNYQHDWASFAFQFSRRAGKVRKLRSKYVIQLIASQLFLLTPFIFALFVAIQKKLLTNWKDLHVARIFYATGFPLVAVFSAYSLFSLVKMNWLLPAYTGWFIAVAFIYYYLFYLRTFWIRLGFHSSVILIFLAYIILLIPNIPLGEGNTWSGWKHAANEVYKLQQKYGGKKHVFLFANSYKAASLVKFYLPDQSQEVYAQNVYKQPALQFDYWPLPDSLKWKDAIYVFDDRREYKNDLDKISPYFRTIVPIKKLEITFAEKIHTRTIFIYLMRGYNPDGY